MSSKDSAVPRFYLYGEPHRGVDERFVHAEMLDDRSRPSEWTIRPHAHAELNHILHISAGGGTMPAEASRHAFTAPCLLIVPAGIVHGFELQPESCGAVVTFAASYLEEQFRRDPEIGPLFANVAVIPLAAEDDRMAADRIGRLMRELGWAAPGHRTAADAELQALMVTALRLLPSPSADTGWQKGSQAALVARLRQRIEERFRLREPVSSHARALGVSPGRLRAACARIAHQSPSEMLDQRALLEAKRALLFSNFAINEIAYSLGFGDAAYFSRFFTRHTGRSPRAFRERREAATA